ncbi:MAG: hypothetical protein LUH47_07390 [Clostridiales bacterium]|nr:hypothetical protein [Clostridiales bacterium]
MSGYVIYLGSRMFIIKIENIFLSGIVSLLITWIITSALKLRRMIKAMPMITAKLFEAREIIERCHRLFPIEVIEYKGITFKRGMHVKITLSNKKTFAGNFIGVNTQNMVCVITPKNIIAQELKAIENLVPDEQA